MAVIGKVITRQFRLSLRCPSINTTQGTYSIFCPKPSSSIHTLNKVLKRIQPLFPKEFCTFNRHTKVMGALSPLDPSSFARPEFAVIKHVDLLYNVDFEKKILNGTSVLTIEVLDYIEEMILDTSDLNIEKIEMNDGTSLTYKLDEPIPNFGSKLTINLPQSAAPEQKLQIKIKYSTVPSATALQWLDPNQTSGKKYPYMFSQCQPVHARSILPCQDTPAVKFTYEAEVSAPEEFTVLMSAIRGESKGNKTTFSQPVPIPSYLLALAVGVLESRRLGPRSHVWSEKAEIEQSAWEFAETEKYLQAAERLCGPYQWTQYDLLVLPPSFPYGGMENPCLTFVTPTLLAGDRSQANVIVHEIMHSWTGNLVTNRNFEHFWLNEGFTVFLERKVAASLIEDQTEAKKSRDFESILGLQELNETVISTLGEDNPLTRLVPDLNNTHPDDSFSRVPYEKGSLFLRYLEDLIGGPGINFYHIHNCIHDELGDNNALTKLVVNLNGVHPDDAFSTVPYEKGSLFLRYLEDLLGGHEVFDDFLRSYLNHFQRQSIDTDQFKDYLLNYFKDNENLSKVDWDTWLFKNGMPPIIPDYDTSMTKSVNSLLAKINEPTASFSPDDVKTFSSHQIINLLQSIIDQDPLPPGKLNDLGVAYNINNSRNTEITYRWLRLCIRSKDKTKLNDVFTFLNNQGRMKYVRPIYRDLYAWEEVRDQAIENFLKNEPYMMHVTAYTLRKDLHLSE
ncbi:LOW QUALITY PROTEIN: leukotriene A-4 hydrolase [Melitaea cinxia]|uniref:LOW QUALITY PROTEIN: leukotriene A-4 hydrolase n=1 Tax=Melitaea cinxia TaxID=113334 RepID=UPI001E26EBD4|nr:LOW QUALITY PROTEIN: leukotriene A-4 hydrolase [Melitaea cinxia]